MRAPVLGSTPARCGLGSASSSARCANAQSSWTFCAGTSRCSSTASRTPNGAVRTWREEQMIASCACRLSPRTRTRTRPGSHMRRPRHSGWRQSLPRPMPSGAPSARRRIATAHRLCSTRIRLWSRPPSRGEPPASCRPSWRPWKSVGVRRLLARTRRPNPRSAYRPRRRTWRRALLQLRSKSGCCSTSPRLLPVVVPMMTWLPPLSTVPAAAQDRALALRAFWTPTGAAPSSALWPSAGRRPWRRRWRSGGAPAREQAPCVPGRHWATATHQR
mmetsp:Transcript_1584/g.5078  ORF Transcript_1584/g.5078 Transcript_1584/m.5078 type:complete len:274 (-) Transcript_1584:440-1261(-)